jgi:hypothetical protein
LLDESKDKLRITKDFSTWVFSAACIALQKGMGQRMMNQDWELQIQLPP